MGEGCDDGNLDDGDGCSKTCTLEGGFMCGPATQHDTAPCTQPGNTGECLQLPIIYRDFKNESVDRRSPRLLLPGRAPWPTRSASPAFRARPARSNFNKRYCVPNSSGPAKKNDSTNRCWDLAQANLGANGKPVVQHDPHRRDELRLPVHRLEPRHQRRPRPRLRHGAEPDHRPHLHGRRQRPPDVPRAGAGRHQRHHASASGGSTAPGPAARTRSASWRCTRSAAASTSSRAR